jgi:MFS family permease
MRLWTSETIGAFGRQITFLALSFIAINLLYAGAFEMGILYSLGNLAFPLLGLFVGVWADRWPRRPIMIFANLGRMITLVSIPLAFLQGTIHLYNLYIVAAAIGTFTVFYDISYQSYLPTLIDRTDLIEGNSKLETSQQTAGVVGPTIASFLISLVGAAQAILADVFGFLISAILIFSIRKREPTSPISGAKRNFLAEMKEGLRIVFRNVILRRITICTAVLNLGSGIFFAVFQLFAYNELKLTVLLVGVVFAIGGVGNVIGAVSASRIVSRIGLGRTLVISILVSAIGLAVIPLALHKSTDPIITTFWIGLWFGLSNLFIPVYNISQISLRQAITPDQLQGRMNATIRTLVWGVLPLGFFAGGLLGIYLGIVWTLILGAIISALGVFSISLAPVVSLRDIPHAPS